MNIKELKIKYPHIEVEALFPYFPRMPLLDYPDRERFVTYLPLIAEKR